MRPPTATPTSQVWCPRNSLDCPLLPLPPIHSHDRERRRTSFDAVPRHGPALLCAGGFDRCAGPPSSTPPLVGLSRRDGTIPTRLGRRRSLRVSSGLPRALRVSVVAVLPNCQTPRLPLSRRRGPGPLWSAGRWFRLGPGGPHCRTPRRHLWHDGLSPHIRRRPTGPPDEPPYQA